MEMSVVRAPTFVEFSELSGEFPVQGSQSSCQPRRASIVEKSALSSEIGVKIAPYRDNPNRIEKAEPVMASYSGDDSFAVRCQAHFEADEVEAAADLSR